MNDVRLTILSLLKEPGACPELAGTDFAIQHKNAARPVTELCTPAISASLLTFRQAARALSFLLNIPSYRQQAGAL